MSVVPFGETVEFVSRSLGVTPGVLAMASAARATCGESASSACVAVKRSSTAEEESLVPVRTLLRFWRESSTSADAAYRAESLKE